MKGSRAYDVDGVELNRGDWVRLLEDHPNYQKIKKGSLLRVDSYSYRMGGVVVWLASKTMERVYNYGVDGKVLRLDQKARKK